MDIFAKLRTDPGFSVKDIDDISLISADNHTLLQEAIVWRQEIVSDILNLGVDFNHQDNNGQTALQYAISRSLHDIAMVLIEKGADPNVIDKHGNNSIWTAIMNPKPDYSVVAALMKANANPRHQNAAGRTAFDMANTKKNARLIQLLGS